MTPEEQLKAIRERIKQEISACGGTLVLKHFYMQAIFPAMWADIAAILKQGEPTVADVCERLVRPCEPYDHYARLYSDGSGSILDYDDCVVISWWSVDPSGRKMLAALDKYIAAQCHENAHRNDAELAAMDEQPQPDVSKSPLTSKPPQVDADVPANDPPSMEDSTRPERRETRKQCADRWTAEFFANPPMCQDMPRWFVERLEARELTSVEPSPNDPRLAEIQAVLPDDCSLSVLIRKNHVSVLDADDKEVWQHPAWSKDVVVAIRRLTAPKQERIGYDDGDRPPTHI